MTRGGPKAPAEARLLVVPVLALYIYLILDLVPPTNPVDRTAAYLLGVIAVVVMVGSIAVRLRAAGMVFVFLVAAILQAFTMLVLLVMEWKTTGAVVFISFLLIMSHLLVAWRFRRAARMDAE